MTRRAVQGASSQVRGADEAPPASHPGTETLVNDLVLLLAIVALATAGPLLVVFVSVTGPELGARGLVARLRLGGRDRLRGTFHWTATRTVEGDPGARRTRSIRG